MTTLRQPRNVSTM